MQDLLKIEFLTIWGQANFWSVTLISTYILNFLKNEHNIDLELLKTLKHPAKKRPSIRNKNIIDYSFSIGLLLILVVTCVFLLPKNSTPNSPTSPAKPMET